MIKEEKKEPDGEFAINIHQHQRTCLAIDVLL